MGRGRRRSAKFSADHPFPCCAEAKGRLLAACNTATPRPGLFAAATGDPVLSAWKPAVKRQPRQLAGSKVGVVATPTPEQPSLMPVSCLVMPRAPGYTRACGLGARLIGPEQLTRPIARCFHPRGRSHAGRRGRYVGAGLHPLPVHFALAARSSATVGHHRPGSGWCTQFVLQQRQLARRAGWAWATGATPAVARNNWNRWRRSCWMMSVRRTRTVAK